jgi:nucleoside-triphosphatase
LSLQCFREVTPRVSGSRRYPRYKSPQRGVPSELCVDRFGVDLRTVETLVVPAIETALRSADLLIMGQIGKMEIASPRFRNIARQALNSPLKIIATVPNYPLKFLNEIRNRPDVLLVEITKENEGFGPQAILKGFVPWLYGC